MPAEPATLLVASGGGHLKQLHRLRSRLRGVPERSIWVTFDSPQSRSLLEGEETHFARFVAPRDWKGIAANHRLAGRLLRRDDVQALVSTGSGLALAFFPLAAAMGVRRRYIESSARHDGPSVTGRVVARVPGTRCYTQHEQLAGPGWDYVGSILDDFAPEPHARPTDRPLRVVVALGTIPFGFGRLLERLERVLPADAEVTWQLGETTRRPVRGDARATFAHSELVAAFRDADVVVAHAGVGSSLDALEAGRLPVLVPREVAHGEHIDDHQAEIARLLDARGLAVAARVEELGLEHLHRAAAVRVRDTHAGPPIDLGDPR